MDHPSIQAADLVALNQTKKISIIVMMTAACIGSNYAMLGIINVKLMDVIVFITGLAFGSGIGMSVGVLSWAIYGLINPYGFVLPILIATATMESVYGLVGGLLGREGGKTFHSNPIVAGVQYAIVGLILTIVYDLVTNIVFAISFGIDLRVALIGGLPFTLVHTVSNVGIFFVGVLPAIKGIRRLIPELNVNV
jgi:uncharacterized membrane protein